MQGTKIGLLVGGMLLAATGGGVQAEALQPDPAWQEGKLENGFSWQLLTTPQRPGDRIELRLMVNAGSLVENAQQIGFAHLLPRLALTAGETFSVERLAELWPPESMGKQPQPPVTVSYDFTSYNLSLPNNRPELLKDALAWLAETAGRMTMTDQGITTALNAGDIVATYPRNPQDPVWRYRLKDSTLLAHDPAQPAKTPVDAEQLRQFYKGWYTPDAMTLYVVGHVDSRSIVEQIGRTFSSLQGKREAPAPVPTLAPLPLQPVSLMNEGVGQDTISLVWDMPWHPIRDSSSLTNYWHGDLAREALFWHVREALEKEKAQLPGANVRFDCNVLYTRAQCGLHLDVANYEQVVPGVRFLARELLGLRDGGLTQQEFEALIARKNDELSKLFAMYARTGTDILMQQRLRSQQSGVVDIAPEQYQTLRQGYLSSLTPVMLNQELHQQLSQDAVLMLVQQKGEPEVDMKALNESYRQTMSPPAPAATEEIRPQDDAQTAPPAAS